jgi:Transposase DNA-binding/Transposase Tn5 dimerisation domain
MRNMEVNITTEPFEWAKQNFSNLTTTDIRLNKRIIKIAEAMAKKPGTTLPGLFGTWKDTKAIYRLLNHDSITPAVIQDEHKEICKRRISEKGTYLLIEDTSEFSWSGHQPIEGLGPIGSGKEGMQGFLLQSVLAARYRGINNSVEIIGLPSQQFHIRKPRPKGESRKSSFQMKKRERESQLWTYSGKNLGQTPPDIEWIRICDRGADIYELLLQCQEMRHSFVIRASADRTLVTEESGVSAGTKLFKAAETGTKLGEFKIKLRSRKNIPARVATLSVRARKICLISPKRPRKQMGKMPSIHCWILNVKEINSKAKDKLEWKLLCSRHINNLSDALECIEQYKYRWLIEEYHKAIKTGLGAEKLQLESAHALFAAISIMNIVALRLIDLREKVKEQENVLHQNAILSALEIKILEMKAGKKINTYRELLFAVGQLGGFLGRKGDGTPGMITLWRGMNTLRLMVEGYYLLNKMNKSYG